MRFYLVTGAGRKIICGYAGLTSRVEAKIPFDAVAGSVSFSLQFGNLGFEPVAFRECLHIPQGTPPLTTVRVWMCGDSYSLRDG
jgi:hypothetical protein